MKQKLPINKSGEMVVPVIDNTETSILQESGQMYDPASQHLDLSPAEKRRTTALLLAINAYQHLIIKDAEYLKEMHNEARGEGGPVIRPATMNAMVEAAIDFDDFISGEIYKRLTRAEGGRGGALATAESVEEPATADKK